MREGGEGSRKRDCCCVYGEMVGFWFGAKEVSEWGDSGELRASERVSHKLLGTWKWILSFDDVRKSVFECFVTLWTLSPRSSYSKRCSRVGNLYFFFLHVIFITYFY